MRRRGDEFFDKDLAVIAKKKLLAASALDAGKSLFARMVLVIQRQLAHPFAAAPRRGLIHGRDSDFVGKFWTASSGVFDQAHMTRHGRYARFPSPVF